MQGLKEYAEGKDLRAFVEHLFLDLKVSDSSFTISVLSAYSIGCPGKFRKTPRDILSTFPDWETKAYVLTLLGLETEILK